MKIFYRLFVCLFFLEILSVPLSLTAVQAKGCHAKVIYEPNGLSHIKFRHWYTSTQQTSRFIRSMTDRKLEAIIAKTLCYGVKGQSSNPGHHVKQYTFKKPIGKSTGGKQHCYTLKVVINSKGQIVTAYPT